MIYMLAMNLVVISVIASVAGNLLSSKGVEGQTYQNTLQLFWQASLRAPSGTCVFGAW